MSGLSNLTNSFNLKASGRGLTQPADEGTLDLQGRDSAVLVADNAATFKLPKAPEGTVVYVVAQANVTVTDVAGSDLDVDVDTREVGIFICSNSDGTWAGVLAKDAELR